MEERIIETRTPAGDTHTHTEIVRDAPARSGGAGWLIAIVLIVALVVGAFLFMQNSSSEVAKDNAIAGAAESVGNAAESVGDAADQAADSIAK